MQDDLSFVPQILLCGDEAIFLSQAGTRPFKIIGHAEISGANFNFRVDGKFFFDRKVQDLNALTKYLDSGAVDYFVFTNMNEFAAFRNTAYERGFLSSRVVSIDQFKVLPREFFYDATADFHLMPFLKNSAVKTLLDADGYFSRGKIFTKLTNDFTDIDGVTEKILPPIAENIYTHVYKNLAEVGFKHYDAILLVERAPADFGAMLALTENFSDKVITFARIGSALEKYFFDNPKRFAEAIALKGGAVNWYFLTRRTPPEDFKIYVVTHKHTPHEGKLPDGYQTIHAGHAAADDLDYPGDDSGDNISALNPHLNEMTALYWLWKNTSHTTIGLAHYRRFFTESGDDHFAYEKILTRDAAQKILERYDIIVGELYYGGLTQREWIVNDCGKNFADLGEKILLKHLMQTQPDYLDAFELVMDSTTLYKCNMFVTRRNVFDAYCKWLFSFLLDATAELLRVVDMKNLLQSQQRIMAYFSERLMTVWLIKNRLRVKELKIMQVEGL